MHADLRPVAGDRRVIVLATILALALIAAATPAPATTPAWTLDRCLEAAQDTSPRLETARARVDAARALSDAAGAQLYPVLGLTGRAGYTTETLSIDFPAAPAQAPRGIHFGDGYDFDLMLGVRVPLYQGGGQRAERAARQAQWRASLAEVTADSLDLRLQVRRAFFGALGAQAAAGAARQGEDRLRRHLEVITASIDAGTATEEARIQVLARLRRTQQTTVQADAAATAQCLGLGRLVGTPGQEVAPTADLTVSLLGTDEGGRPWDERPELRALDSRIDAAEQTTRAAGAGLRPAVDLEGGWHYGRPGVDPVTDAWMDYGTVVLSLRWPLFDFGRSGHRVRNQRAEKRALTAARRDTDEALHTRLANARTQRSSALQERDHALERVTLERQRLGLLQSRWHAGNATETELLDVQDDVTVAEMDLAMTRARLRIAEAELLAALGR
ncbi:MAG: TolC family protein [Candidatus Eiseniibacteriota bacterium]|jgi:outer membrane protein